MKWSAIMFRLGVILLLVGFVPGFLLSLVNIAPWLTVFLALSCAPPAVFCLVLAALIWGVEKIRNAKRDAP